MTPRRLLNLHPSCTSTSIISGYPTVCKAKCGIMFCNMIGSSMEKTAFMPRLSSTILLSVTACSLLQTRLAHLTRHTLNISLIFLSSLTLLRPRLFLIFLSTSNQQSRNNFIFFCALGFKHWKVSSGILDPYVYTTVNQGFDGFYVAVDGCPVQCCIACLVLAAQDFCFRQGVELCGEGFEEIWIAMSVLFLFYGVWGGGSYQRNHLQRSSGKACWRCLRRWCFRASWQCCSCVVVRVG
jgi:hypothetical protein